MIFDVLNYLLDKRLELSNTLVLLRLEALLPFQWCFLCLVKALICSFLLLTIPLLLQPRHPDLRLQSLVFKLFELLL